MKKKIVIHQPDFVPYLGFFYKVKISDLFIILDDVQFIRRGWHHRDKIKTKNGAKWLSCSTVKDQREQLINKVRLSNDNDWKKRHLDLLSQNYSKSAYYETVFEDIKSIYDKDIDLLIDFNIEFLKLGFDYFNINTPIKFSSSYDIQSKSTQRILSILKKENASTYITGVGSKGYLDTKLMSSEDIEIEWIDYQYKQYKQLFNGFERNLSFLDLLFNHGKNSLNFL